jgi:hypothetical protein
VDYGDCVGGVDFRLNERRADTAFRKYEMTWNRRRSAQHFLWLAALLFWPARPASAQSKLSHIEINLRPYGWKPPIDQFQHDAPSIAIDDKGRVLVGFRAPARNGLVTRNQPSLDFRILRFSPDGKFDVSLSLPTRAKATNGIYLSDTGQIIARANDALRLFASDDGSLQKGVWKTLCEKWCGVLQSHTRRTMILGTRQATGIIRFPVKPTSQECANIPLLAEPDDRRIEWAAIAITDQFSYSSRQGPDGFAYRWPLCEYEKRVELPHPFDFVTNDKLFIREIRKPRRGSIDRKLEVVALDGSVKFEPPMSKDESVTGYSAIRSSAQGDRIAVDIATRRGGNLALDIGSHPTARRIGIYDVEAGKEVASISVSTVHRYGFDFALSADGRCLATLEDDLVKISNLP